jgi:hypothetical protein
MQDYQVHLQLHTLRNHNQLQLHTQVEIVSLLLKNQLKLLQQVMPTETLTAKKFFPFRAYRNGGVPSGPPPKRGPNPQVPPIKLRNGGVKTNSKKSVSMRGVGKAIRGTKFSGVY